LAPPYTALLVGVYAQGAFVALHDSGAASTRIKVLELLRGDLLLCDDEQSLDLHPHFEIEHRGFVNKGRRHDFMKLFKQFITRCPSDLMHPMIEDG
jgi:hypothetical protein